MCTVALWMKAFANIACEDGVPFGVQLNASQLDRLSERLTGELCVRHYTFLFGGSFLNLFSIIGFGKLYGMLSIRLNDFENWRTEQEWEDGRVVKSFVFQFINNFFLLFYIAFAKVGSFMGSPNYCTLAPISNTMPPFNCSVPGRRELRFDNTTQTKTASGNCLESDCMLELQLQLIVVFVIKTNVQQLLEIVWPVIRRWRRRRNSEKVAAAGVVVQHVSLLQDEVESHVYDGTFDDINEMVVQFGYVVLFATAFPAAPFCAFVNNVIEIRGDAFSLCKQRRPVFKERQDLGEWISVLNVLAVIAVGTNAALTALVATQTADILYRNDYLSGRGAAPSASLIFANVYQRAKIGYLWLAFLTFEHGVMLLRSLLETVIPDKPAWLIDAEITQWLYMKENGLEEPQKLGAA